MRVLTPSSNWSRPERNWASGSSDRAAEHVASQRVRKGGEARRVDQTVEQAGVVVGVDRADLDGQRCRATDEVKHRHDRCHLLAFGEGSGCQRAEACVQPGHLTGVGGRARRGGLQNPRMAVVHVPQSAGPNRDSAAPIGAIGCRGWWPRRRREHEHHQLVLVGDMAVERHGAAADSVREPGHRQRAKPIGIGQFDRCRDDPLARQPARPAGGTGCPPQ